jgi:hypothetical protein
MAGVARNGVFILLGLVCVALLAVGAGPGLTTPAPRPKDPPKAATALGRLRAMPNTMPAAAWDAVALQPEQKARLDLPKAGLQRDQSAVVRAIAPTAELLRREYLRARNTRGQEKLALSLRFEILRLTAPLQKNEASFVREARGLLNAEQKQDLHLTGSQLKAAQLQRARFAAQGGAR